MIERTYRIRNFVKPDIIAFRRKNKKMDKPDVVLEDSV